MDHSEMIAGIYTRDPNRYSRETIAALEDVLRDEWATDAMKTMRRLKGHTIRDTRPKKPIPPRSESWKKSLDARVAVRNARRAEVAKLFAAGCTFAELMEATGVSVYTIREDMKALGLRYGDWHERVKASAERREKVVEMKNQGVSTSDIAVNLGVLPRVISNDLTYIKRKLAAQ